jgi:hypothetical protein
LANSESKNRKRSVVRAGRSRNSSAFNSVYACVAISERSLAYNSTAQQVEFSLPNAPPTPPPPARCRVLPCQVTYDLQTRWLSGSTFGHHRRQVIAMAVHVDKSAIAFRDSFFGLLVLGQVIGQRLVEAIFESDQLRVSIRINEPINTNQHQSTPINTNQHQSSPIIIPIPYESIRYRR